MSARIPRGRNPRAEIIIRPSIKGGYDRETWNHLRGFSARETEKLVKNGKLER